MESNGNGGGWNRMGKWWVLGTVCFAIFMVNLDGNVVSLAIPTIVRDFNASLSQIEWVTNAYLLTFAVFLITLGRLGDEIGRKKLFLGGLVLFALGSALCGAAASMGQLVVFRVIQGIGGSAMMPATLSLIAANFRAEERGRAMGFWGAVSGLAFIAGPIIGGYLTQNGLGSTINTLLGVRETWRYVFYLNVPFGLLAFFIGVVVIPESQDPQSTRRIDFAGVLLSSLAVFLLTYAFIEGPRLGWWTARSALSIGALTVPAGSVSVVPVLFALALLAGSAFIVYERKRRSEPLVDLSLFSNRNYSMGMIIGIILNFTVMGATFLLPLFFQSVLGISPVNTGAILVPFALAILVTSPIAGILSDRLPGKYIIVAGMLVLALSDLVMGHFTMRTTPADTILAFVIMGIGMGLSMTPITNLTLSEIPAGKVGGASGVLSTTRQIGAVMGIAVFSVILQSAMVDNVRVHMQEVPGLPASARTIFVDYVADGGLFAPGENPAEAVGGRLAKVMESPGNRPAVTRTGHTSPGSAAESTAPVGSAAMRLHRIVLDIDRVLRQAFTDSINTTILIASLFGALGAFAALFLQGNRKSTRTPASGNGRGPEPDAAETVRPVEAVQT